jgi:hypothetical protein
VETTTLPGAKRGTSYTAELKASGGVPPYKWKKLGSLPQGLKLSKTGVISGTPSAKLTPADSRAGHRLQEERQAVGQRDAHAAAQLIRRSACRVGSVDRRV